MKVGDMSSDHPAEIGLGLSQLGGSCLEPPGTLPWLLGNVKTEGSLGGSITCLCFLQTGTSELMVKLGQPHSPLKPTPLPPDPPREKEGMMAEEAEKNGSRVFPGLPVSLGTGGGASMDRGNHCVYTCPHLAQTLPWRLISASIIPGLLRQAVHSPLSHRGSV